MLMWQAREWMKIRIICKSFVMAVLNLIIFVMAFTVSSVNVRSICSSWRRAAVFDFLGGVRSDVICIQECGVERAPCAEWKHGVSLWSPMCESKSEGVGILIKSPHVQCVSHEVVVPGRLQIAVLEVAGSCVRLINCYVPADKRERVLFLETLKMWMPGRIPTILIGDFNCVRKSEERQSVGGGSGVDVTSKTLNELVNDFHLQDTAVVVQKSDVSFTFFSDKGSVRSRIDFIFASLALKVIGYQVDSVFFQIML